MTSVTTACRAISELTPLAQQACKLFLTRCKSTGLDIFITETYRPQERQDYLYEQGRSRPGQIVTWTKTSRHTSRRAWDIACNGGTLYNLTVLAKAGQIAADLGITWGGTWNTPDRPHFEIGLNWKAPVIEILKAEEDEYMTRYNKIEEVPEWAKGFVQELISEGAIADKNNINLSEDMVREMVIMDRHMKKLISK